MNGLRPKMVISPLWFQAAILTFVVGFTILGYLAVRIQRDHPPIPDRVQSPNGDIVFTATDILAGQHLFQKYGLMQFGTIFGHGAYLGPDFTAQYLHRSGVSMLNTLAGGAQPTADVRARVAQELQQNLYDPASGTLLYSDAQTQAFGELTRFYTGFFGDPERQTGPVRVQIRSAEEVRQLTSYFAWSAWAASARRPRLNYSYTNNWPPEPLAGNSPTADAFLWSVFSLIALLGGTGAVLFFIGRYDLLGWHRSDEEDPATVVRFRAPEEVRLTPSQRATAWFFLVVAGLFLLQGLLGGVNAHYHVEPRGFYGADIGRLLPYNLSRMWHLQLALFFVCASFLAMGIFITPMIARREPKHQEKLAIALFGAVVIVVLGSLAGEAASIKDYIQINGPWFWIGAQGWEYLDLGRLWQILLVVGMVIWVAILVRGMRNRLSSEHPGNMPYLFLYSAISIPLFYAAGLAFGKNANFAVQDFWRFWVVHL
jgi:nitric oxide reductase subunit B